MKCQLTIQEKLKDLRNERGLSLVELAEQTGLSKSALGSYESDEYKDISHTALITLAKFYNVSGDYLLGLTENRAQSGLTVDELGLDDETIELLKSKKLNNRLICEMIKHPHFANMISDLEIYVDNLAGMQIRNMNTYISHMRAQIQDKAGLDNSNHNMKTLEAALIDEDKYFSDILGDDISLIAKALREVHKNDSDTGDDTNVVDEINHTFEELQKADNHTDRMLIYLSSQLKMNLRKMDPYELKTFTDIVSKHSELLRSPKGNGRGKKKK